MPVLPTITGVHRVTLNWRPLGGINFRNVLHVRGTSLTASQVGTQMDAALSVGQTNGMFEGLSTLLSCVQIDILPLDGTSPTFSKTISTITGGGGSGEYTPAVAAVVSLKTGQRGSRGRGRFYGGPIPEAGQENGVLNATRVTDMTTGWNAFVAALIAGSPSLHLVVASYKHADAHDVTSIRVDSILGTQRRRQDQLR
jgi:hypothetical protein